MVNVSHSRMERVEFLSERSELRNSGECRAYSKAAFTLAEVLITLGVIGVVVALTIPQLVSRYEKRVIETGLQKTYSELQSVVRRAEADYGPFATWDYNNGWINRYIVAYMPMTQCVGYGNSKGPTCNSFAPDRFTTGYYRPTETSARGERSWTYAPTYVLNDGREIYFTGEFFTFGNNQRGIAINMVVDVNGRRGQTVMGQDVFIFSLCNFRGINDRLKAGPAASWSENHNNEYLIKNCIKTIPYVIQQGSACIHLLERNGWKFPKDYPIKF